MLDKKTGMVVLVGAVLLGVILLGIGVLLGRSFNEPEKIVLKPDGEQNNSINFVESKRTLTVVGQNIVKIKPEIALISLGIEKCDPDAKNANAYVNNRLLTVTSKLQEIGLDKTQIIPSDFSLYPKSNYSADEKIIYCANNKIRVTSTKLDLVNTILDNAIESGATSIEGVNFTVNDIKSASEEGIKLAYNDAENQAQTLAKLMNSTIQNISSSKVEINGYLLDTFIGYNGAGGSVMPQNSTLTIKVTVVYNLES